MILSYAPYILKFKEPAGTSRGVLTEKKSYFIRIADEANPDIKGYGEVSLLPGLSVENDSDLITKIIELKHNLSNNLPTSLAGFPALKFGLEQAILDLENGGKSLIYPSDFTSGLNSLQINGLVWMGNKDIMISRLMEKIEEGYHCIKIKIGAIRWEDEIEIIRFIRERCGDEIEIRVDANGGLTFENCLSQLNQLAELKVHSIEQPIPPRNFEFMKYLCEVSPVRIALDEELIGIYSSTVKQDLLDFLQPAFIILKPSLCGGFSGAKDWIRIAEEKGIGWWITSALESSVGLNAIAQFTGALSVGMPQGLGTGNLYENNFKSKLCLEHDRLYYNPDAQDYREELETLEWI